ncbi:hypothetical protein F4779DRAFT_577803 [Xylariaceae sp. FL0662B]|nr:hypothetical protein F4779DRAFT_577803 [Xylariaceae sp. FL0662B]
MSSATGRPLLKIGSALHGVILCFLSSNLHRATAFVGCDSTIGSTLKETTEPDEPDAVSVLDLGCSFSITKQLRFIITLNSQ